MTGARLKTLVNALPDEVDVYIDSNEGGMIYPARECDIERVIQLQSLTQHNGEWNYTMRLRMNSITNLKSKAAIMIATT